jgi:hypothetical protein
MQSFWMLNLLVRKVNGRLYKADVIPGNTVARGEHNARCYRHCQGMKKSKEIGAEFSARTYYCEHVPPPPPRLTNVFVCSTWSWEQRVGISAAGWPMWWGSSTLSVRVELHIKQYQGYSSSDELYRHKHLTKVDPTPYSSSQYAVCFSEQRHASLSAHCRLMSSISTFGDATALSVSRDACSSGKFIVTCE